MSTNNSVENEVCGSAGIDASSRIDDVADADISPATRQEVPKKLNRTSEEATGTVVAEKVSEPEVLVNGITCTETPMTPADAAAKQITDKMIVELVDQMEGESRELIDNTDVSVLPLADQLPSDSIQIVTPADVRGNETATDKPDDLQNASDISPSCAANAEVEKPTSTAGNVQPAQPVTEPAEPEALGDGSMPATSSTSSFKQPSDILDPASQVYQVKWISWNEAKVPIVTQNENGPCPLLAIMNVLLLRGQVTLPDDAELVSGQQLMSLLGDCILRLSPQEMPEAAKNDYEQNVSDAMGVLSKLMTGLDVNVRFTGISDFEYTPECLVFDLLNISLYHGWLVDSSETTKETVEAVGTFSYNQLVEKIVTGKTGQDSKLATEAILAEQFLESCASQLTYHGLTELNSKLKDGELAVLFRNNHFSTLHKHKDELFLLVTDQGFLHEKNVVWETLNSVDGDSHFADTSFHTVPPKSETHSAATSPVSEAQQIDQDYLIALTLDQQLDQGPAEASRSPPVSSPSCTDGDHALALQLQQEESEAAEAAAAGSRTGARSGVNNNPQGQQASATTAAAETGHKKNNCVIS